MYRGFLTKKGVFDNVSGHKNKKKLIPCYCIYLLLSSGQLQQLQVIKNYASLIFLSRGRHFASAAGVTVLKRRCQYYMLTPNKTACFIKFFFFFFFRFYLKGIVL